MAALDTNVLVRYLVEDDLTQLALAKRLIRKAISDGQTLFVPVTVFLELEWVLRTSFGFAKNAVLQTLNGLLASSELSFESEKALELARLLYAKSTADFSDCVHVALVGQAGEQPFWTFDRAASKLEGAKLLAQSGAG
jgi:predicted nucleic-acid-binding protein